MTQMVATPEAISAAADQLAAEGRRVTSRAVRDIIGGGSETTIVAGIHRWQRQASAAPSIPSMPDELRTAMTQLAERTWAAAWQVVSREIDSTRQLAEQTVRDSQAKADDYLELSQRLEADLQSSAEQNRTLVARVQELEIELARSQEACLRLVANEEALAACRKDLEGAAARAVHAESRAAVLELELDRTRARLATTEQRLEKGRDDHQVRISELERREAVASAAAARVPLLELEVSSLRRELLAVHRQDFDDKDSRSEQASGSKVRGRAGSGGVRATQSNAAPVLSPVTGNVPPPTGGGED
jgi:hypothetical protein